MKPKVYSVIILFLLLSACAPAIKAPPTLIPVSTSTTEPEITNTPTLYDVSFVAFHDFNGNGVRNEDINEILLSGVIISMNGQSCTTDNDGTCAIKDITENFNEITIDPSGSDVENLNFLFWGLDVFPVDSTVKLQTPVGNPIAIALGQGPITIPVGVESFHGLWDGIGNYGVFKDVNDSVHWAVDIQIYGDGPQIIYAPISGIIEENPGATKDKPFGDTNHLVIIHRSVIGNYNINMGHLSEVFVKHGQLVNKGDPIGAIDPSLYTENISSYDQNNLPKYYQGPGAVVVSGTEAPHVCFSIYGEGGPDNPTDFGWGMFNPLLLLPVTNEAYPWISP